MMEIKESDWLTLFKVTMIDVFWSEIVKLFLQNWSCLIRQPKFTLEQTRP